MLTKLGSSLQNCYSLINIKYADFSFQDCIPNILHEYCTYKTTYNKRNYTLIHNSTL